MSEEFIARYGRFILLIVFLISASISGCNWNDNDGVLLSSTQAIFQNSSSDPVNLSIDSQLRTQIDSGKSYYYTSPNGVHTYSAVSIHTKKTISGGTFAPGDLIVIK